MTDWKNFHGNIAINDDCMEIMATLPDKAFELAIVDPPYGIGISLKSVRQAQNKTKKDWDDSTPKQTYFSRTY